MISLVPLGSLGLKIRGEELFEEGGEEERDEVSGGNEGGSGVAVASMVSQLSEQ